MDPIAFHILGKPIYWYGVMVALAFVAATFHWNMLGKRENRPPNFGSDLALLLMLAGIFGGRLAYLLANASYYIENPAEILRIDKGGLIFYGGFIVATIAMAVFARIRRESALSLMDFGITAVPLGHAYGRVGCFINGCCYGKPWDGRWAIFEDGAYRHPVQLYESIFNVCLYLALLSYYPRKKRDGQVLAAYLIAYGAWRFSIEFLRGDERVVAGPINMAQWISIGMIVAGAALWAAAPKRAPAGQME